MWKLITRTLLIGLIGGFATATLVRIAPGYGMSDEQLDARRTEANLRSVETRLARERSVLRYYGAFLFNYARGDWGESPLFQRPVRTLIAERTAVTLTAVLFGLSTGWAFALAFGVFGGFLPTAAFAGLARSSALLLQCTPAVVVGLLLLSSGARGPFACAIAVGLVLYPRLVLYVINLTREATAMPHVLTARAKGLVSRLVLFRHVLPVIVPELLALAGISVSMALSVAIPLEMILDIPGLGQLTWQAALGRDMNLLVNLTMFISLAVSISNAAAEWTAARWSRVEAGTR
ncbi:MAG: ABC transporter permease [Bryobacteraceae bacterium]|nr:ABC transporter permease [Bryobacteraceae bacterium]